MDAATGCLVTVFCHFPSPFHKPFPNDLSFPYIINILSTCLGLFIQQRLYIHPIKKLKTMKETLFHIRDTIRIIPSNTCFPDSSDLQFLIYQFRIFLYSSIFKSLPSKIKLLMSIGKHIRTQIIVSGSKEFIFFVEL